MKVSDLLGWLDEQAPFQSAEGFDNVGLLIGNAGSGVKGVFFGLDVTRELLEDAIQAGANVIITHHPFLFHPIKRLDTLSPMADCLRLILSNDLNIIAMHTNWDKAPGGISDELACRFALENRTAPDDFLRVGDLPTPMTGEELVTLVHRELRIVPRLYGDPEKAVKRLAVAGGAYGEAATFAKNFQADALITGEIRHHEILEGVSRGLVLICAEHYATEFPGLLALSSRFSGAFPQIKCDIFLKAPFSGAIDD